MTCKAGFQGVGHHPPQKIGCSGAIRRPLQSGRRYRKDGLPSHRSPTWIALDGASLYAGTSRFPLTQAIESVSECVGIDADPTRRWVALGRTNGVLQLVDLASGKCVSSIHTGVDLSGCAWLSDGQVLVLFAREGLVWLTWRRNDALPMADATLPHGSPEGDGLGPAKRPAPEGAEKKPLTIADQGPSVSGVAKDGIEPPTQGFSILCSTD